MLRVCQAAPVPVDSDVLIPGPWTHRDVSANGARFHVAEAGAGPLVLALHGFPQFWWCWRHQLIGLAEAGFRVVAPDLRGYGASDKPPRGYDVPTLVADCAGLVRALGEQRAIVVGHDWGGVLAWALASLHPEIVDRLVVLGAPHPLRMTEAMIKDPRGQLRASWYIIAVQTPVLAERQLLEDDASAVGRMLQAWSGPGFPTQEAERAYRDAIQIPGVAHSALEWYRWAVRSSFRPDGARYRRRLREPVHAPTLQLHGALDTCTLPRTAQGSGRYVAGTYEWRLIEGAGHFLPEEVPDLVTGEIVRWAKSV